jgi:hypothetical protein
MISLSQYMIRKYEKRLSKLLSRGIKTEFRNAQYNKLDAQSDFWFNYKAPNVEDQPNE